MLSGRATFTVDGERVAAPAGSLVFVKDPGNATRRGRRRGGDRDPRDRRPAGRGVLGLAVGALGRGAALLDDRRLGSRDRRSSTAQLGGGSATTRTSSTTSPAPRAAAGRSRRRDRAPRRGRSSSSRASPSSPQTDADLDAIRGDDRFPRHRPPASASTLGVARQPHARREGAEAGHRVVLRARHEQHGGVVAALRAPTTRSSSPTASANALCASSPPNGHELLGPGAPGDHVTVGDRAHRDVGDERLAVARGDRDRERVRARQRRSPPAGGGSRRGDVAVSTRHVARPPRAAAPSSRARRSGSTPTRRRASPRRRLRDRRRRRSLRA